MDVLHVSRKPQFRNEYPEMQGGAHMENPIGMFIRRKRKEAGLTQEEFAMRSGLGLRFVHELERGKPSVRLDKVNQALAMFGMEAVPGEMERKTGEEEE